jgi:signal transduction histidine kinase
MRESLMAPSAISCPPDLTTYVLRTFDWLSVAAIATWLVVGVWPLSEMVRGHFAYGGGAAYVASFLVYGAAMLWILFAPRRQHQRWSEWTLIALAVIETVTAITMNVITVRYIHGSGAGVGLLVIIAAELPYLVSGSIAWSWIAIQTIVLTAIFFPSFPAESLTMGVAIGGFQMFAAASSMLAIREGRARTNLTRVNAELVATRELLAESSRTSERLRISRDLHDTLGHHLTALSLQLDVAARLSDGKAAEHVQQAHAITRLLLSDVRAVVGTLRESSRLDLAEAIRALVIQPTGAQVHLTIPDTLVVDDAGRAETILRAVQEVLTNTARHARAANLWIRLEYSDNGIMLHARDDGHGTGRVVPGNGLRGMKERYQEHGGHVEIARSAESGFELRAFMPIPPSA